MNKDAAFALEETHELAFQDGVEFHRAIVCVPKRNDDNKKEVAYIILQDNVENIEFIDNSVCLLPRI